MCVGKLIKCRRHSTPTGLEIIFKYEPEDGLREEGAGEENPEVSVNSERRPCSDGWLNPGIASYRKILQG
jgi:hypothetical protein